MDSLSIPLTRGYVALIDEIDYERVARLKWHVIVEAFGSFALTNSMQGLLP